MFRRKALRKPNEAKERLERISSRKKLILAAETERNTSALLVVHQGLK